MAQKLILQNHLDPTQQLVAAQSLPGMRSLNGIDWITVDDTYSAQLSEKARLLADDKNAVLRCFPEAEAAAQEILDEVLKLCQSRSDFEVHCQFVIRPDGKRIKIKPKSPLLTLSRLLQEDICILQRVGKSLIISSILILKLEMD